MTDEYNLQRFLDAQERVYDTVLDELRAGRKSSHWIWFIFPQITGLGHSGMAQKFAITSLDEAKAYLQHPVLGPRLRECTQLVLNVNGRSAEEIFGYPGPSQIPVLHDLVHDRYHRQQDLQRCPTQILRRQARPIDARSPGTAIVSVHLSQVRRKRYPVCDLHDLPLSPSRGWGSMRTSPEERGRRALSSFLSHVQRRQHSTCDMHEGAGTTLVDQLRPAPGWQCRCSKFRSGDALNGTSFGVEQMINVAWSRHSAGADGVSSPPHTPPPSSLTVLPAARMLKTARDGSL